MGTSKRERQKANRQARLEEMARQARRQKTKKRSFLIGGGIVGGVLLLALLAILFGGDDNPSTPAVTTVDPASTTTIDPSSTTTSSSSTTTTTTVAAAFAYGTGPCPAADGSSTKPEKFDDAPKLCIDPSKGYTAEVSTNKGDFTIELDPQHFPGNVNNFVTLARYHYYDGTGCHRIVNDFVVQCGRPGTDETAPGYNIPDELPEPNVYEIGYVVMANSGEPNSGGGQFFIVVGKTGAGLPNDYSIIGRVTKGLESTVKVLHSLADPMSDNGVPPIVPVTISSVTITEGPPTPLNLVPRTTTTTSSTTTTVAAGTTVPASSTSAA